jgi:uncharacterized protein
MSTAFNLYQLQIIDSQILENEKRILAIQNEIEFNPEMVAATKTVKLAEETCVKIGNAINEINVFISQKKVKSEQSESSLYSGNEKNPKVLQDFQLEIGLLKKQINDLENQLFELLLEDEKAQKLLEQAKLDFHLLDTKFNTTKSILTSEKASLQQTINRLKTERETAISQISPKHQEEYKKLATNKQGIAISTILDGTCSVCGNTFTPAQCQSVRSQKEFFYCPSCHRIVYGD